MDHPVLGVLEYGNYISIVKLAVFWACFVGALPLLAWMHRDAKAVGIQAGPVGRGDCWGPWPLGCCCGGPSRSLSWACCLYVLAIGTVAILYVRDRNTRVLEFDRLLTVDHVKRLLSREAQGAEAFSEFVFVTKNNNQVPFRRPRRRSSTGIRSRMTPFQTRSSGV